MGLADQFYQEMANAPMFGAGQWFHEGKFIVKVTALKLNDGFTGKFFVSEFEVEQTSNTEDPQGSTRSYLINLDTKKNRNAYADAKKIAFALLGVDPESIPNDPKAPGKVTVGDVTVTVAEAHAQAAQLVAAILDQEFAAKAGIPVQAFIGQRLALECWGKPMKTKEGTFTVHKWKPLPIAA